MPFGFHKKDKSGGGEYADYPHPPPPQQQQQQQYQQQPQYQQQQYDPNIHSPSNAPPEFRMFRSDTTTQEQIFPPAGPNPSHAHQHHQESEKPHKKRLSFLRRGSTSGGANASSEHVPAGLVSPTSEGAKGVQEDQWEARATQLGLGSAPAARQRSRSPSFSNQGTDKDIQEAIRLHEAGDLENSTRLFRQLADPAGANNPLSQVLYGLALRHGWGTEPNSVEAVKYLQAAAANSASIEQEALRAGMKKGGAAKGELVLAIFELGNCFRHGWGTEKDPVAAFNYYQTAANLGDTDAMNETAWCYLNGYGVKKKDKWLAAKYYRLAEENGNKTVGNSWIYKDKYVNPK